MKIAFIVLVLIVVIALFFMLRSRSSSDSGYSGAIGFKNQHTNELASAQITGFSKPVTVGSLTNGEHSFNYFGAQEIPALVQIEWRFVNDTSARTATVAVSGVPADASPDSVIWFVLSPAGVWVAEYSPQLHVQ